MRKNIYLKIALLTIFASLLFNVKTVEAQVRPKLCQSAKISKTSLAPGESLTITSTANTSDILRFTYVFYNLDNLYEPNNPKPISFVPNIPYSRSGVDSPPGTVRTNSITVKYDELDLPDLNWDSKKPKKIQVNAYFTNSAGEVSLAEAACVVQFNMLTSPTATPTPIRPKLCQSATISSPTLSSGGSLKITSTANTSGIIKFTYAFYNRDNLYPAPDGTPKPIFFTSNTPFLRSSIGNLTPPLTLTTYSITVGYAELDHPDLNWDSKKPTKIQVNAYFTNSAGEVSLAEAACVVKFDMSTTVVTPTINPACTCGTGDLCNTNCTFDPPIPNNPMKCSLSDSLFPTVPSAANKTSWCQANKRTKGDADGNGSINAVDYFYYVAAVNGGKIPVTVNPDFNGDGEVGAADRTIIIKSLTP